MREASARPGDVLQIGLVAGEASGDALGAGLIEALHAKEPALRCAGVAGPRMVGAGCEAWAASERLAIVGLTEVLAHLPDLLRLRRELIRRFLAVPPDVFVGIDVPDFNLPLARRLRAAGIPTVQYVSPQFWAWRPGRVHKIAEAVDRVLCLFPFERDFYERHGVDAQFVGHPLADQIPMRTERSPARAALGIPEQARVVAVLPGSRSSELKHLGEDFAGAVAWLAARRPELHFVAPMATRNVRNAFEAALAKRAPDVAHLKLIDGRSREALAASDVALLASGTAALETMLIKRPMVVAYRLAPASGWMMRKLGLLKIDRYAMPNLLAGRELVPELMQEQVSAEALGRAVAQELDQPGREAELAQSFATLHETLRNDADETAARGVLGVARKGSAVGA